MWSARGAITHGSAKEIVVAAAAHVAHAAAAEHRVVHAEPPRGQEPEDEGLEGDAVATRSVRANVTVSAHREGHAERERERGAEPEEHRREGVEGDREGEARHEHPPGGGEGHERGVAEA
jgi:hypothetical protein